jgi:hypothetical protein
VPDWRRIEQGRAADRDFVFRATGSNPWRGHDGTWSGAAECYLRPMNAFKAHVVNGRIVVDEPTDLPDGTELFLVPAASDDMDDEERAELESAIQEGLDDFEAGRVVDEETIRAKLRAYR